MNWQEAESETMAGIKLLQQGLDDLLALIEANKSASDNSVRWKQFDSILDRLERAVEELRRIRRRGRND